MAKRRVNRGAAIERASVGVVDKQVKPSGVNLQATDYGREDIVAVHARDEEHANVAIALPQGRTKTQQVKRAMQRLSGLKSTETARAVGAFGYAFGQYAGGVMTSMHSAFVNERTARWYHNPVPVQHATEEAKSHVIDDAWDAVRAVSYGLDPRQMATSLADTASNESMMNTVMHHAQSIRQAVLSNNIDTLIDTAYTVSKDLGFIEDEEPPEQQPQDGDGEGDESNEGDEQDGESDNDGESDTGSDVDADNSTDSGEDRDDSDGSTDDRDSDTGDTDDSQGQGDEATGDSDGEQGSDDEGDDGSESDGGSTGDSNDTGQQDSGQRPGDSQPDSGQEQGDGESSDGADGHQQGDTDGSDSEPGDGGADQGDDDGAASDSRLEAVHKAADKAERDRQAEEAAAKAETERAAIAKAGAQSSGAGRNDNHNWTMVDNVACVEAELHHSLKGTLEQFMQTTYHLSDDTGGIASDYIGEMNIGNLDVFYEERREKGNIVIAVDCSGSMNGMCTTEDALRYDQYDQQQRRSNTGRRSRVPSAYLAWQSAMALGKAFEEAEVIGYHGNDERTTVGSMLPGMRPWAHCDSTPMPKGSNLFHVAGGGTPECTALLVMQEMLSGRFDGSAGVIITDGYPNDIGHTSELAYKMARSGMAFAVVAVGNDQSAKVFRTPEGLKSMVDQHREAMKYANEGAARARSVNRDASYYTDMASDMATKIEALSKTAERGSMYPMEAFVEIETLHDLPKLARVLDFLRERSGQ